MASAEMQLTTSQAFSVNDVLGLKRDGPHQWRLRSDDRRAVVFRLDEECRIISRLMLLHPSEAIVLSFFDGVATLAAVEQHVAYVFSVSDATAHDVVDGTLRRWRSVLGLVDASKRPPTYQGEEFVVAESVIDLSRTRLYRPISLSFHVSDDCMRNCVYCNIAKRKTKDVTVLPLDRWRTIAREAAEVGVVAVQLAGGDPFVRKDIISIIDAFRANGLPVFLSTKPHITPRVAAQLADVGVTRMQVSLDASSAAVCDSITRSPGSFTESVDTIRNLIRNGIKVRTNTVVTSQNVGLVKDLVALLVDLGADIIRVSQYGLSAHAAGAADLLVDPNDMRHARDDVLELRERYPDIDIGVIGSVTQTFSDEQRIQTWRNRAVCTAGRYGFVVLSDGQVILCDELPTEEFWVVGDLSKQNIMEVWESPKIQPLLRPNRQGFAGTVCFDCPDFDPCHEEKGRCFRDSWKAFGTFYAPTAMCPKAPPSRRLL